jgi:predicted transcriptional regulator
LTTLENHEENVEYLISKVKLTYGKTAIEWRRYKVLELDSQGYSQHEIAQKLHISRGTVNSDSAYLRKQAQDNLQHHIHEVVPEYYQKCLWGMKRTLKQTLEIAQTSPDPKIKLEAMKIANDCYRYIMDLVTNGSVITDAIKHVSQIQKDVDTIKMLDKNSEVSEGETTTNGVF